MASARHGHGAFARERGQLISADAELGQDLAGVLAEPRRGKAEGAGRRGQARNDVVHRQRAHLVVRQLDQRPPARRRRDGPSGPTASQTGPTVTPASSNSARFSACVRWRMKSATMASIASLLRTRSVLVAKRGSCIRSARPMAWNSRSAIDCIDADSATNLPSLQS